MPEKPSKNQTYTEKLTEDEIVERLMDYEKVEDISTVKINTHIRYFSLIPDKHGNITRLFRLGGFLSNKDNVDKYIILSNGKTTWSVQTANSQFYRKMTLEEVKEQHEAELEKLHKTCNKLLKQNNKFKTFINSLGYDYHDI